MEEVSEAFEMVLGKDFIDEMISRLIIIGCVFGALLAAVIIITVWRAIACGKIKKAVMALSEHPNDEQAQLFVKKIKGISVIGRFFAKLGFGYSGLSKGECRTIFNSTVLPSDKMSSENKTAVRNMLMKVGCSGLTASECR